MGRVKYSIAPSPMSFTTRRPRALAARWARPPTATQSLADALVPAGRDPLQWTREWVGSRSAVALDAAANLIRLRGGDKANEELMNRLNRSGDLYLTHTKLDGKFTLRLCVGQTNTEERHVELDNRPRASIGRSDGAVALRPDISIETRLAVAHDRRRRVAGRGVDSMIEPGAIARRDQDFGVKALEGFGVRVINDSASSAHQARRPLPW